MQPVVRAIDVGFGYTKYVTHVEGNAIGGFHMHEFKTLSGRLIEARRYLTRAARLRDHDPARERWELWLTTADGQEEKHVVTSRLMPARSGHAVTLILLDDEPVGMFNLDAGYRVNFARADPALLLRPVDVAIVVFGAFASLAASMFTGPAIFVLAVPLLAHLCHLALRFRRAYGTTFVYRAAAPGRSIRPPQTNTR